MPELNLEQYAEEQKKLFESMGQKLKGVENDRDAVQKAMEEFKTENKALKTDLEAVQTKLNRNAAVTDGKTDDVDIEKKALRSFCRTGSYETPEIKELKDRRPEYTKALSTNPDTEGGFLLPHNLYTQIVRNLIFYSPIREMAKIVTLSQGDTLEIPTVTGEPTVGRVAEKGARTESTAPTIGFLKIPTNEYYANPYTTQKLLDDSAFDVEGLLAERVNLAFQYLISGDYINGTGVNMAKGFTGETFANTVNSGAATDITLPGLVKLLFAVKPGYRVAGQFAMNSATCARVYALANATNYPLLQPSLKENVDFTFMGKAIREFPELPDCTTGSNKPVYFGNWQEFYTIVDRMGIRVLRDPYSSKPYIQLYTTWRTGGQAVKLEAMAQMNVSA